MIQSGDYIIDDLNFDVTSRPVDRDGIEFGRGLIERDYEAHPVGSYAGSVTFGDLNDELPLIPWEAMPDLIADKVRNKSQLSDIRNIANNGDPIPSLDQNGQGYCTTEETEILTERGWVQWPQYNGTDLVGTSNPITGQLEFQRPLARQVFEYDGEIVGSSNRRIDFAVTPNHRMLVRKWNEQQRTLDRQFSFVEAKDIGWYAGLPHSTTGWTGTHAGTLEIPGDRVYDGDDFVALMGLVVSDGYAGGSDNTKNWVSFASFRDADRETIASLAQRCGFHEQPSRPGVWIRYDAASLAEWIRVHCYTGQTGALNKKVPQIIKELSQEQIGLFLRFFDDRSRDGSQYFTASKRLADDIQELCLRLGKRAHIGKRGPKSVRYEGNSDGCINSKESYVVTVGDVDRLCIDRKKHLHSDRYRGNVYCLTVPNGTLVTRLNGSVLVSGNCWFYSVTSAVMLLRAVAGLPYVRLSGHSGAWVIKGGRDQGGWGAAALEYVMKNGICPTSIWPEKSMNGGKYNTQANWAEAAKYKVIEGFIDLDEPVYSRDLSLQQRFTCLLCDIPVIGDRMWWQHSTCDMDLVDANPSLPATNPLRYGVRTLNSWTDRWGNNGTGVLTGNKVPASGVAPRAVRFAA